MPTIDDYTSGKVLKNIKLTLYSLKLAKIPVLGQYPKNPLILAKVSNKYMNICRSNPKDCTTICTDIK